HIQLSTKVAQLFLGGIAGLAQGQDALDVQLDAPLLRLACFNGGAGGCDQAVLAQQLRAGLQVLGFSGGKIGLGLGQCVGEVPGIEAYQQIAGLDGLVISDQHLGDLGGELTADAGNIAMYIGVVGRFIMPADEPPVGEESSCGKGDQQQEDEQTSANQG